MSGWELIEGDARAALTTVEAGSADAVVTDPPYGLKFMGRAWDGADAAAFDPAFWALVLAALKPGGHLVAFGGTRTCHRMVCAIEDAGFEVRDQLAWMYGSGLPKSLKVAKAIDRAAGTPGSPEAAAWDGWGTALKPAHEPIVLARKPLVGTVAANVLAHGVGALNIDACRVATVDDCARPGGANTSAVYAQDAWTKKAVFPPSSWHANGRWPANVVHDGSDEVVAAFPHTHCAGKAGLAAGGKIHGSNNHIYGLFNRKEPLFRHGGGPGPAARFFYSAKASPADRAGSRHPTVKPVSLMRWLVRMITPPGGLVLDPFAGSGTTGAAALAEGCRALLIEREAEYAADIRARLGG